METIALESSNQGSEITSLTASLGQTSLPRVKCIPVKRTSLGEGSVTSSPDADDPERALQTYLQRKARTAHPDGGFDSAGRWYPSASEKCSNCDSMRSPSRNYPYSLMTHCRSAEHVAELFGVDALELKRAARKESKQC